MYIFDPPPLLSFAAHIANRWKIFFFVLCQINLATRFSKSVVLLAEYSEGKRGYGIRGGIVILTRFVSLNSFTQLVSEIFL